mmetsp:Transcript_108254/g.329046  ORF Transcript_108254/g.329046 Transcript_108254/m.329046 type:complete len:307 (+) Transcript_108254:679-1599(+)
MADADHRHPWYKGPHQSILGGRRPQLLALICAGRRQAVGEVQRLQAQPLGAEDEARHPGRALRLPRRRQRGLGHGRRRRPHVARLARVRGGHVRLHDPGGQCQRRDVRLFQVAPAEVRVPHGARGRCLPRSGGAGHAGGPRRAPRVVGQAHALLQLRGLPAPPARVHPGGLRAALRPGAAAAGRRGRLRPAGGQRTAEAGAAHVSDGAVPVQTFARTQPVLDTLPPWSPAFGLTPADLRMHSYALGDRAGVLGFNGPFSGRISRMAAVPRHAFQSRREVAAVMPPWWRADPCNPVCDSGMVSFLTH